MSLRKKLLYATICAGLFPLSTFSGPNSESLATQLGWVVSPDNFCGGYYLEEPFIYPTGPNKENLVETTGNQGLFSFRGTSVIEGKVTINRSGQQITTNKALLYRDPVSGKLNAIDLIGHVNLREPNTLIVAKNGRYNFENKSKSLMDVLYRTTLSGKQVAGSKSVPQQETQSERKITMMTAWGKAYEFSQTEPQIYELNKASFSTCPPTDPAWRVKGSHIVLNKNTGRGYVTNARILVKNIPVFYFPYINFSIDGQRKTGFLWPTIGIVSNKLGPYVLAPFYWNIAPNYDMTITPGLLTKRGIQVSDNFRYLTETSSGNLNVSVLPNDKEFQGLQKQYRHEYSDSSSPVIQSELNDLLTSSSTRRSLIWRNQTRFNESWSSNIDFNYAGDDYYLQDFGSSLNEITQNQLLQEGDLYYKSPNWNFIGRVQAYQTLHPIIQNQPPTQNQYRRFPQLILSGDYPEQRFGLEYFIDNELTHFNITNTPGNPVNLPIGNRMHTQPGISLPLYWPYLFVNPRLQMALTDYQLYQTTQTATPDNKRRALPIFDFAAGLSFNRDTNLFGYLFQQTLEPQIYYTFIPYRNQSEIPVFDTTVNTLTYDQIFNYNRFTGLDRIGDANQLGFGVTTRLISQESGLEKVRVGVGDIVYFANRRVTLCNSANICNDYPQNPNNFYRLSPVSGVVNYYVNPWWSLTGNSIWNPITKQIDNSTVGVSFLPREQHLINIGYTYARGGDILSGVQTPSASNNLKVTDLSVAWPLLRDVSAVGRWSQNWNHRHLQNLLYGLQYDTCCWAVRFVGGRAFTGLNPNNNSSYKYNSEFYIQFALKGLGNIGGDPTGLLSSINGYNTQFG